MKTATAHFNPALFAFLRDLAANNNRDWFNASKKRYEAEVRNPCMRFIADLGDRLADVCPAIVADARPVGGSFFRIYRDVRFSKDKSPYKTHAGLQFRHRGSTEDVHGPGYYLHLDPDEVFFACGLWQPAPASLGKIRDAIVLAPDAWQKVLGAKGFESAFKLGGESLKRAPAGYDPAHPLIEDLKRKDFIASVALSPDDVVAGDFMDRFVKLCAASSPFMGFLTNSVGLDW